MPGLESPLVTVVTPSLNQSEFIRATIESVLAQDYPRLEYIVIDGGSTDATPAIVREYSSRLTFPSEPDRGQSHAVNKGFRLAKGSVLAWLNSDDLYLPGAISAAVKGLDAHPDAAAVYGEGYLIDRAGNRKCRFPATAPFHLWTLIHLSDYILQQTVFFRRRIIEEIGYLDEDLHYAMDWDLLIRIGKRYPLQYLDQYLACLREYPEAKSFRGGRARIAEIGRVMRRHAGRTLTPGYCTYALEAYKPVLASTVRRYSPRVLAPPLEHAVTTASNLLIDRVTTCARRRALSEK